MRNCITCRSGSNCTKCDLGYGINAAFSCTICSDLVKGCLYCSNYSKCETCLHGYELTEDGKCENGKKVNIIAISLGVAGGVIFLVVVGTFSAI